jgi:hypothetical protein
MAQRIERALDKLHSGATRLGPSVSGPPSGTTLARRIPHRQLLRLRRTRCRTLRQRLPYRELKASPAIARPSPQRSLSMAGWSSDLSRSLAAVCSCESEVVRRFPSVWQARAMLLVICISPGSIWGPRSYLAPTSIRTGWHDRGEAASGLYLCPWPQVWP